MAHQHLRPQAQTRPIWGLGPKIRLIYQPEKSPQSGAYVEKWIFAPARTFAAEQKVTYRVRGPAGLEAAILNF